MLSPGTIIDGYRILSLIKLNDYTETYRVSDSQDEEYFLKLYILKRTPERLVNSQTHQVLAIERSQGLQHPNLATCITTGSYTDEECGECPYIITSYFTGDVLADVIQRRAPMPQDEAIAIYTGIIEGLAYLHSHHLCHHDVTPSNVMLNHAAQDLPELIDLGHLAPPCLGKAAFDVNDLDIFYCANETMLGIYDESTDIFSATAVLFTMLTGAVPWRMTFTDGMNRARRFTLLKDKRRTQVLPIDALPFDEYVRDVLRYGLAPDPDDRFADTDHVLRLLQMRRQDTGSGQLYDVPHNAKAEDYGNPSSQEAMATTFSVSKPEGKGFAEIAGMASLKEMLQQKVIFILKNPELARQYRLTPPNGMLLYGPPGCGKTFFAEKFAEEAGFNFIMVKSSDLASTYIHGSQEKIGHLFRQAEKQQPIILCFDEFDALVPNRSGIDNQSMSGEVNEFLTQLNNCSKRGIFVIATSNRPDKIDPAVLRTGRIDKTIFVPLPDLEARREMFRLHLDGRPFDPADIDLDLLASRTEGYIASDIAYIVNDAAMTAAFTTQPITMQLLLDTLQLTRPSLSPDAVASYDKMRTRLENTDRRHFDRQPIGFKP